MFSLLFPCVTVRWNIPIPWRGQKHHVSEEPPMAAVLPAAPVGSCPGLPICQSLPVSHVCVPLSHVCSTPCFIMRLSMTFLCPCWGPSSRGGGVVWGDRYREAISRSSSDRLSVQMFQCIPHVPHIYKFIFYICNWLL